MNILELLKSLSADNAKVETYDLTTEDGYKKFKKSIKSLKETNNSLFDLLDIDFDDLVDNIETLGDNIYKKSKEIDIEEPEEEENDVIEDIEEPEEEEKEDEQKFNRPSELLTIPQKLQLHKLVQEYVDTTIKPFNKGILTNNQINDAYAGLYEFAAWVLNKKN